MVDAVLEDPDTHEKISRWAFIVAAVRYLIIRIKLKPVIDPPNAFSSIHGKEHPLLVSFKEWLGCRGLDPLETLFSFPITIMGYGQLADIPAPYALKYMSVKTFFPMVATSIPLIGPLMKLLFPWPRRFHLGFQRLWQRVAWRTNVRLNINITEIDRQEEQIRIKFEYPQQKLNELKIVESCMDFDYLVLACPLTPDVFARMRLTPTQKEEAMSDKIIINPYCMTTYWIEKDMPQPVAPVLPIPERGVPWAVARQFQGRDKNHFTQFYTRPKDEWDKDKIEKHVKEGVQWLVKLMDSKIDPTHSRWHSFDEFTYFQHVNCDAWKAGFYCELAKMQGAKNTFYVGGATDFELVEPIVAYAKHIVESRFVGAVS